MQGISAGTIIYVVMFEVLQREMVRDVPGLMQLVLVLIVATVILTILFTINTFISANATSPHST